MAAQLHGEVRSDPAQVELARVCGGDRRLWPGGRCRGAAEVHRRIHERLGESREGRRTVEPAPRGFERVDQFLTLLRRPGRPGPLVRLRDVVGVRRVLELPLDARGYRRIPLEPARQRRRPTAKRAIEVEQKAPGAPPEIRDVRGRANPGDDVLLVEQPRQAYRLVVAGPVGKRPVRSRVSVVTGATVPRLGPRAVALSRRPFVPGRRCHHPQRGLSSRPCSSGK